MIHPSSVAVSREHRRAKTGLQRNPNHYGAEPKYWIGRITAAQAAWRTGPRGWEYSEEEEVRLLVDYFDRNHAHRSGRRITNGLVFITDPGLAGWQGEKAKMAAVIETPNIQVDADDPALPANNRGTITNYIASFQSEYILCLFIMHSDWLNHYFAEGENQFPANFPNAFSSPGSNFQVPLLPANTIKAPHIIAIPNKAATSRFYLLGGCDVGAILHRPQFMVDGEHISPATPLHRQYGAQALGVAYLMHGNGLAVLAHNVTNPPGDYTPIYDSCRFERKTRGDWGWDGASPLRALISRRPALSRTPGRESGVSGKMSRGILI